MTWKAKGKPISVDESQPVALDEGVTEEQLVAARQNWSNMSKADREYVTRVRDEAEAVLASVTGKSVKYSDDQPRGGRER